MSPHEIVVNVRVQPARDGGGADVVFGLQYDFYGSPIGKRYLTFGLADVLAERGVGMTPKFPSVLVRVRGEAVDEAYVGTGEARGRKVEFEQIAARSVGAQRSDEFSFVEVMGGDCRY